MYWLQSQLDFAAAARHVAECGFTHTAARDEALVIKTVLTEALGGAVVRPWRLEAKAGPAAIVTGYSELDPATIERRRRLALPSLQATVHEVRGVRMPDFTVGERLRFTVRLCPTVRVTVGREGVRHGERDAYLHAIDLAGGLLERSREEVYRAYLCERLPGAEIDEARMIGFRIQRAARKAAHSRWGVKAVPIADITGLLRVSGPEALCEAMRQGVGRQRAFGCGMLRLEPAHADGRAA